MAMIRPSGLPLVCLAAAMISLAGCKPDVPGGLVAADRPTDPAAQQAAAEPSDGIAAASPQPVAPSSPPATGEEWPPSIPIVANPGLIPVDVASGGGQQGSAQPAGSQSAAIQPRARTLFRLSAGVAVPQSLPTGTAMGMSVDYQSGGLNQSSRYVWVVKSEGGGNVEQPFEPLAQGTLQTFFLDLRPEHRPFNSHIEEISPSGRRTRVSNVAVMQTSY